MTDEFLKHNAVYQIYPASFCDSNGDGWGDIQGIISKLDYLHDLGIRIIWLSPVYDSPMVDMGYDISDYYKINPRFGTMEDFDTLILEAKKRDMRIIMDLVVNHTSDKCAWFQEALKNPDSPYRDYYVFKKGKDEKNPPNNWTSTFTGPAWEPVENEPNMYYLHIFTKEQPDLNWHNEKVVKEVENIMSFWMDKGVYGFRCDVISAIYKDSYADGKKQPLGMPVGQEHYIATSGNHEMLKRLRRDVVDPHHGVLIGECMGATIENSKGYLDDELDTFFAFEHTSVNANTWGKEYIDPKKFKKIIEKWQKNIDFNGNYLENHDQHRSINKYIKEGYEIKGAKMLLTLIYTLRGVPFVYMGEEFGAMDYPKGYLSIEECNDCVTQFIYKLARSFHLPKGISYRKAVHNGRDDARYPMAFDDTEGHGFTSPGVTPWQKFNPMSKLLNAKTVSEAKNNTIEYFKKLNEIRREDEVLSNGTIEFLDVSPTVLCFRRKYNEKTYLVLLNLDEKKKDISSFIGKYPLDKIIISNTKNSLEYGLDAYGAYVLDVSE